jgi:PEP-CTERM motif
MRLFARIFLMLAGGSSLYAGPCISGNDLSTYAALGSSGCDVGTLTVKDFSFSVISSGGGATPIAATDITVTTEFGSNFFGLSFSSPDFSVTGTQFVNYLIAYTWDPTGDMRGLGDVLDPGSVNIVSDGCVGAAFSGSSCSATTVSVNVFEGATSQLTDFVAFPPTGLVGIRNTISLNANGGSASFKAIENDVYVPEPAAFLLFALGLIALAARRLF